jgi:hypothetical protein
LGIGMSAKSMAPAKRSRARSRSAAKSARAAAFDASPELRKGDVVTVFGIGSSGPYIEGRAVVRGAGRRLQFFRVVFASERVIRTRFVHPDWQEDPERSLRLLIAFWEASVAPPEIDEFFPTNRIGKEVNHG